MSSPEERLNELCSGNEETRDCCSFEGQTYGFFKGRYWLFSNFTMEISSHGVLEDGSNVFFLKCNQVQGGFFEVAVCLQDLDSFPKLYNKFRTSRPPGSTIILDTGMKGGVHLYVGKLVAKYEAQEDDQKTCVLTASKPGFLCTGYDGLKVFVLGPDQILPATTGCDDEIISHLRLKWIGPKPQKNLQVGPSLDEQSILSLFDQLRAYHGMNFPSILMMMAYSKLATNLSTVSPKYNLPSCHLVGDMATGKSRAADHMRAMSPFALSPNGSKSVVKLDNPTETILNQMLCVPGPVLIFDPPPALKDSAINQILDHAYQGVMHRTQNNVMESLDVSTGPVFVHAHEKKSMRAFSPTSLSKAVVGLHQRTKMADHGEMSKIDQDIMKTFAKYSAMYRFMVLPLDEDDLDMDRNAFTQNFKSELQDKFDSQILDTNSRLIQNYGLYCASLKQLLNDMPLTKAYCSCVMKELFDFFVNVCIPENLKFMMVSIGSKQLHGYVPEAVMKTLWNILGEMEFREFFQYVSLGQRNKSISISKEIFKDPARQLQNAQTLLESKFATNR